MKKRVHAIYEGRVQGVGFRFTCQRIAEEFNITGWVRNMPDGNVEIVAEGKETDLYKMLAGVKDNMARYIMSDRVEWQAFQGEFKEFNIRF